MRPTPGRGVMAGELRSAAAALLLTLFLAAPACSSAEDPRSVSFATADGGEVWADLYGGGDSCVVLAHGRVFDKESWAPQAERLAEEGHRVLAIDFRGYGRSRAGSEPRALELDVLAAVRFLAGEGCDPIAVVGGSMGGGAAARAARRAEPGEIDALALLGSPVRRPGELVAGRLLFVASEDESAAAAMRETFEAVPEPKRLEILPGGAHAQHVFGTAQGERLMEVIVEFLAAASG